MSSKRTNWLSFELAAANIVELFDRHAKVTHDERIRDRCGRLRQFDVVIRGSLAGQPILAVIECKDWTRRVDVSDVEAFVTKATGVCANLTQMVSRRGFTSGAIRVAKNHGIGLFSLLRNDRVAAGLSVGIHWYVEFVSWANSRMVLYVPEGATPLGEFNADTVTWGGKRVIDWWGQQLTRRMRRSKRPRSVSTTVRFKRPRYLTVDGKRRRITQVEFESALERRLKICQVQIGGLGMIDWTTQQIRIAGPVRIGIPGMGTFSLLGRPSCAGGPKQTRQSRPGRRGWRILKPGQSATLGQVSFDPTRWQDVEGDLGSHAPTNLGLVMRVFTEPVPLNRPVPDLRSL